MGFDIREIKNGQTSILVFTGELVISEVEKAKTLLIKFMNLENIKLDFSGLSKIDTAGLQLLYSFVLTLDSKKIRHSINAYGESLEKILKMYHMQLV